MKNSKATERCNPSIRDTKKKVTYFEETAVEDVAVQMEDPMLYGDLNADALELFRLEEPHHGADYRNAVPADYELNSNIPKRSSKPKSDLSRDTQGRARRIQLQEGKRRCLEPNTAGLAKDAVCLRLCTRMAHGRRWMLRSSINTWYTP